MKKGFTLIEVLVSVAVFSVVMTVALGALLSMSVSNRKAETLKSVINNLNFSLDSISRAIRTSTNYHCGSSGTLTSPQDCTSGANYITFLSAGGQQTYYRLDTNASVCGQSGTIGCISRSTDGTNWLSITAPEVVISDFSGGTPASYLFYVKGASPQSGGDTFQPKVVMTLSGYVQVSDVQRSTFALQTAVTQRLYDQ